jgi:hypothetical protein
MFAHPLSWSESFGKLSSTLRCYHSVLAGLSDGSGRGARYSHDRGDNVDDHPKRPLLTPDAARATPPRSLLDRIDAFAGKHPGITIAAPYTTFSKLWEVTGTGGTSQWDNGFRMMDFLEQRYGG